MFKKSYTKFTNIADPDPVRSVYLFGRNRKKRTGIGFDLVITSFSDNNCITILTNTTLTIVF